MSARNIDLSANGTRLRLFRDVANITMDTHGVENVQIAALGGADTITVNDLTGTDVQNVAIDLSATRGSNQGDGQADTVIINGTNGDDAITVTESNGVVTVVGSRHPGDDFRLRHKRPPGHQRPRRR